MGIADEPEIFAATGMNRRSWIKGAALATGIAFDPTLADAKRGHPTGGGSKNVMHTGQPITTDPAHVTATTAAGKIRGYWQGHTLMFKGVPYAAGTGGANRFMPPRPMAPWKSVRSTLHYGPIAPQDKGTGRFNDEEAFIFRWNDAVEDEDCLRLNVWTPGLDDKRLPVLVWLHGGGFAAGSGHDIPAFDGENLASTGEAVVVTLNHRLNLLGFLDLSSWGGELAESGNVGMLDIVAALRWIQENIANFGGDPARVTIFGQSGGGAKVTALMGMPSARGLFHRAAIFSGSFAMFNTPERSAKLSALLLRELGVAKGDLAALQAIPYAQLRTAAERVMAQINPPFDGFVDVRRIPQILNFGPVIDGQTILAEPGHEAIPRNRPEVPLIIGSTLNEFVTGINNPDVDTMDKAELRRRVERFAPQSADKVIAAFNAATPDAAPFDLWSRIATAPIRQSVIDQAKRRLSVSGAPTWLFWFTWRTPVLEGRPKAFHCLDIPFWFDNAAKCASMTGGGRDAIELASGMAHALLAFATDGVPAAPNLPEWLPIAPANMHALQLDWQPRMIGEIDANERASLL